MVKILKGLFLSRKGHFIVRTCYKDAVLENGFSVKVPEFFAVGDAVSMDIIDQKYLGRG